MTTVTYFRPAPKAATGVGCKGSGCVRWTCRVLHYPSHFPPTGHHASGLRAQPPAMPQARQSSRWVSEWVEFEWVKDKGAPPQKTQMFSLLSFIRDYRVLTVILEKHSNLTTCVQNFRWNIYKYISKKHTDQPNYKQHHTYGSGKRLKLQKWRKEKRMSNIYTEKAVWERARMGREWERCGMEMNKGFK